MTLSDIAAALPAKAVLIDFYSYRADGEQKLLAAVMTKKGKKPVYTLIAYADLAGIEAAIKQYRDGIQDEDIEEGDLRADGQAAYTRIFDPLRTVIGTAKEVYIVPDGLLNITPFNALITEKGHYLIEDRDLHILSSVRDLVASALPPAKGGYLINAGPNYDLRNTDVKTVIETLERRRSVELEQGLRAFSSGMRGLKFSPLPGAEKEGQLIVERIKENKKSYKIYSTDAAEEEILKTIATPPEVLHIATHGFFLKADDSLRKRLLKMQRSSEIQVPPPGDNPLLRAGLAFAGINTNAQFLGEIDTENDGVLTALEVLGLNLEGTKLAVLSACETGLGEIHEGEGVYGLQRAFQEAGARSVINSLWEV